MAEHDYMADLGLGNTHEPANPLNEGPEMPEEEPIDPMVMMAAEEAVGLIRSGDTQEAARALVDLLTAIRE